MEYEFTLILNATDINDISDISNISERIGATCNDALLSRSNGIVTLDFNREAYSKSEAITSAVRDVSNSGYFVKLKENGM